MSVRLGQRALELGILTAEQLSIALAEQARSLSGRTKPRALQEILLEKGFLSTEQLASLLKEPADDDEVVILPLARGGARSHPPLGKYEIVRELGRGGMGVVYEAVDTHLHRRVALKMLLTPSSADHPESQLDEERFLREARLSANLAKHPHIVSLYEAGVIEGKRYLAMEFIDGQPMSKWRKSGSITIREQVKVLRDVAAAVHHAHQQNIIHRDLKPDNILIDAQGRPHVTDFGLAKSVGQNVRVSLTASGMVVGTPAYMSPEQAIGEKGLDHRTDVYALGVMLYETLTGRLPFTGETAIEILMKAAKNPVPPPSSLAKPGSNPTLDRTIENICLKALAKNPRDRYATAESLANDLTRWLKGEDVRVAPVVTRRKIVKPAKPSRTWKVIGGGVALVVVAALLLSLPSSDREGADVRRPDKAELDRKRETKKQIDRLLEDARSRLRDGKLAESLALFDEVLRKDHANADAVAGKEAVRAREVEAELAKADALIKEGKFREAFRAYGLVSARDPENRRASTGLELAQKKMEEAIVEAKENEVKAKTEADRLAAEKRRKEEEEANRKAQQQVKQAQAEVPGTRARELAVRTFGHDGAVWAVAFSPDGLLASGSVDRTIRLWDLTKETASRRIFEGSGVFSLAFTKDGKQLVSANGDSTVKLWDVAAGNVARTLRGHQKQVSRVALSPDGTILTSAGLDGTARLWDVAKGTLLFTAEGMKDNVYATPFFLSNGKVVACSAGGANIRFLDVTSGKDVRPPLSHGGLSDVALTPDKKILASAGWDKRIRLWDPATGKLLRTCEDSGEGFWSIAISPDGRLLASAGVVRAIKLWDLQTGQEVDTLPGHAGGVTSVAFHPDGKWLASGGMDFKVKVWNVEMLAGDEAWKKSIDLLALVDPRRDTIKGAWRKEGGRLVCEPSNNGCLRLPYEAPEEYDFRVVFVRKNGRCATAQFIVHQGHSAIWDMNKAVGFGDVGGAAPYENATRFPFSMVDNTKYTSVVQVRRDGVKGWINGQKLSQWTPSMGELSTPRDWGTELRGFLGLGNCESLTTFESVQVREVTGKGQVSLTPAPAPLPLPAGLVAYWKLNERTGMTASDSSGHQLTGTMMGGVPWNKEKPGGVLLDGGNRIEFPAAPVLDKLREGSYSVSAWFKPEALPADPENSPYLVVRLPWFSLYYLARNQFMMQHCLAGGSFGTAMAPDRSSPPGAYYHVVGTVDKAAGKTQVYIDGKVLAHGLWPPGTAAGNLWPGHRGIGTFKPADDAAHTGAKGVIHSVRLYSRALTEAEVEALHKAELPLHPK